MSRLDEDLQRRISAALDAGGLDAAEEDLQAILAEDAEASLYARDLSAIDQALSGLVGAGAEPDWDAMAERIDARLEEDAALDDIGDVTAPPELEEEPVRVEMTAPPAEAAPVAASASSGEVVSLDAARQRRRRMFTAIGGLAAAAAVGLGITAGLSLTTDEEAAELAASPVAQEQAPGAAPVTAAAEEAEGDWAGALDEAAEAEAPSEMPAVGAARPAPMPPRGGGGGAGAGGLAGDMFAGADLEPEPEASAEMADEPARRATSRSRRRRRARAGRRGGGATALGASGGGVTRGRTATSTPVVVTQALRDAESTVRICMGSDREHVARVSVTVDGATGRARTVNVQSGLAASASSCVERAVRQIRFPRSTESTYTASYVYRPAPVAGGSMGSGGNAQRARSPASPARDSLHNNEIEFAE